MEINKPIQSESQHDDFMKKFNENLVNLPSILQKELNSQECKEKFDALEKSRNCKITSEDIMNFQNDYIREKYLLDCDEINIQTMLGKKITYKKDDFNQAFLSKNWARLDFSQKYTILHWLQSAQSSNADLPPMNFISPDSNIVGNMGGACTYSIKTNSIYLDSSLLDTGIYMASGLIHEMVHYNDFSNPDIDITHIKHKKINLKELLKSNPKKLIDIDITQVPETDINSVLLAKNLASQIVPKVITPVNSIQTFINYMQTELYYFSPIERRAYAEQSRQLNNMFAEHATGHDKLYLDKINKHTNEMKTLECLPILSKLDANSKNKLLDANMQVMYYTTDKDLSKLPECEDYSLKAYEMYMKVYDHFKSADGGINLKKDESSMER